MTMIDATPRTPKATYRRARLAARGLPLLATLGLLAGCEDADRGTDAAGAGDADHAAGAGVVEGPARPPGDAEGGLTVVDPWVRAAIVPAGSDAPDAPPVNSAGYLTLRNPGPADAIVAVQSPVADTAELHAVTMADGVMRMRPVDSVAVSAGGEAVLEPGGYHIMLVDIGGPLAEGDSVSLTLRLRGGRTVEITAPVRTGPPGG